ncbi:transporter [Betaproteobacteria bacterium]|nr:transporter [Betaproteobacteria bacterium]GHU46227.1 transporter [Betaproteobacteria bacterium]
MLRLAAALFTLFALCLSAVAQAQSPVRVTDAWVRATVPTQRATGAFLKLLSPETLQLVGVRSPVADVAEIHSTRMKGEVMEMRAVSSVLLPAGVVTELKPGGFHIMLLQLKMAVTVGQKVPLTLILENDQHERQEVTVEAYVRPLNARDGIRNTPEN